MLAILLIGVLGAVYTKYQDSQAHPMPHFHTMVIISLKSMAAAQESFARSNQRYARDINENRPIQNINDFEKDKWAIIID
jgi:hypothetical protein